MTNTANCERWFAGRSATSLFFKLFTYEFEYS